MNNYKCDYNDQIVVCVVLICHLYYFDKHFNVFFSLNEIPNQNLKPIPWVSIILKFCT